MEMLNFIKFYGCRNFSASNIYRNIEKSKLNEPTSTSSSSLSSAGIADFIPSEWDRKVLVWSGKYKVKDIPPRISFATLDNARSRLRIRIANIMVFGTICMCGYYIWLGKKYQKKTAEESFLKMKTERQRIFGNAKNE